ncbi:MAG: hypothetical protein K1X74_11470 [Pirellulales bacterium]|nr:hypothetical protein [Pirellulales bacterium]
MNADAAGVPAGNPFATRHVRPGRLAFRFPAMATATVASLRAALESCGGWGQIIGPHGSGKSTLLAELARDLQDAGHAVQQFEMHDGQRRLPGRVAARGRGGQRSMILVDGYEQLSTWSRTKLKWTCRRRGHGLLVTAHTDCGLPTLWQTGVDPDLAWQVVRALLPPGDSTIGREEVAAALIARRGNLRDVLMDLYDRYEARR